MATFASFSRMGLSVACGIDCCDITIDLFFSCVKPDSVCPADYVKDHHGHLTFLSNINILSLNNINIDFIFPSPVISCHSCVT